MESSFDEVIVQFSPESLWILNICLGFIMFVVALDLNMADFKHVVRQPKASIVGLISQLLLLPAVTFALIFLFNPDPGIALGMILVAACPGGVTSNFITHLAKGNTALSVSLTAITTPSSIFMTPFNFALWGGILSQTGQLLETISLDPVDMGKTIIVLILIPITLGMFAAHKFPKQVERVKKPAKKISILIFIGFLVVAFISNMDAFTNFIQFVIILVILHNALALATGYLFAKAFGLNERDTRSISIETGIQNSGLGLILIFNFFNGMGGMALVAACWGIWHFVSGLSLAYFWSRR